MGDTIETIVRTQRRRRRGLFWGSFAVLAIVGGLWANAGRQPIVPFGDDFGFENEVFIDLEGAPFPRPVPEPAIIEAIEFREEPALPVPLPTPTPELD